MNIFIYKNFLVKKAKWWEKLFFLKEDESEKRKIGHIKICVK
jgi:hypothetical protein